MLTAFYLQAHGIEGHQSGEGRGGFGADPSLSSHLGNIGSFTSPGMVSSAQYHAHQNSMQSSLAAMSNHLLHYPSQAAMHGAASALGMAGGQPLTPSQCMALSALLQSAPQRPDVYHQAFGHGLLAGFNPTRLGLYPPSFTAAAAAASGHPAMSGGGGTPAVNGERGVGDWPHFHPGGC